MKKLPPLTKKRRSLADLSPDSLAAALYHRELAEKQEQERGTHQVGTKREFEPGSESHLNTRTDG